MRGNLTATRGLVNATARGMHAASTLPTTVSGRIALPQLVNKFTKRRGDPASPYTTGQPPDLTRVAARNGGTFPAERVFRVIDGQSDSPPPNSRHMPIWGYELFTGEGDDETAHQQVLDMEHRLVKYVHSIQQPATAPGRSTR